MMLDVGYDCLLSAFKVVCKYVCSYSGDLYSFDSDEYCI